MCEGTTEGETSHSLLTWRTAKLSLNDGNLSRLVLGAITKPTGLRYPSAKETYPSKNIFRREWLDEWLVKAVLMPIDEICNLADWSNDKGFVG